MIATRRDAVLVHAMALVAFFGVAVWMSYPLIRHLSTHVPGAASSEDLKFLWNFWWFRTATMTRPFDCPLLFAPFGISLVLDTHTAMPAMVGATLLRGLDVVTANNLVILAGLTLNGYLAFVLAYRQVRHVLPSALAGLIFGNSAYVAIHLLGHFNLIHAWLLPLLAIGWDCLLGRPRWRGAMLVGVVFAAMTYTDYYYTVYGGVFLVLWWFVTCFDLDLGIERRTKHSRVATVSVAGAILLLIGLVLAVVIGGGFDVHIGGRVLSLHHTRNLKSALWVLLAIAALVRWRLSPVVAMRASAPRLGALASLTVVALATYLALIVPLAEAARQLVAAGDYVAGGHHWLSDAGGVDLATLVLGHPLHTFLWPLVQNVYSALGINMIEQTAYLGVVPLLVLGIAVRRRRDRLLDVRWSVVAAVFFLWALGPFLTVAGRDLALILPQAALRYVPLLSNARIPGRALVVVQLAVAMLCAIAIVRLNLSRKVIAALAAVVVMDSLTMPFQLDLVPAGGTVEQALHGSGLPAGSVLELPIGVADGLGELGKIDFRSLSSQMQHGRPLVGGFAARVPDRVKTAFLADPVLRPLLDLSAGTSVEQLPDTWPVDASHHLVSLGVRFIVVNRDTAPRALVEFSIAHLHLRAITNDGPRELYAILEERVPSTFARPSDGK